VTRRRVYGLAVPNEEARGAGPRGQSWSNGEAPRTMGQERTSAVRVAVVGEPQLLCESRGSAPRSIRAGYSGCDIRSFLGLYTPLGASGARRPRGSHVTVAHSASRALESMEPRSRPSCLLPPPPPRIFPISEPRQRQMTPLQASSPDLISHRAREALRVSARPESVPVRSSTSQCRSPATTPLLGNTSSLVELSLTRAPV
jgi:hypothetical protein